MIRQADEPRDTFCRGLTLRITRNGSYKFAAVLNKHGKCVTRGSVQTTIAHCEPLEYEFRTSVTHEVAQAINEYPHSQAAHDAALYFVEMIRRHGIKR